MNNKVFENGYDLLKRTLNGSIRARFSPSFIDMDLKQRLITRSLCD